MTDRLGKTGGEYVSVDAEDFRVAADALKARGFTKIAEKRVKHALRQSANSAREHIKSEARRHRRTGRLIRSIHTTWKGAGLDFRLRVGSTDPVAHLIVSGVRPHEILSRRQPMPIGGVHPFAERVHHPGFRGDPFIHRGIRKAMPEIQGYVDAAGKAMVADLAKKMKGKARQRV
jgi:hypothetical protein